MERLVPALAVVKYRNDGVTPADVTPIAAEDCRPQCSLTGGKEWTIYDYMRVGTHVDGKKYDLPERYYIQLVLKLEPGAGPEEAEAYQVCLTTWGDGQDVKLTRYLKDGSWYFIPPRKDESVNTVGHQELVICRTDRPGERRTVQVYIHSSSLDSEAYRRMLEEVARLHQKLLLAQGSAGTVAVGQRWERAAGDLARDVEELRQVIHRLEAVPDQDLVAVSARVSAHKVKKLSAKTVLDLETGRRLVRTSLHADTLDIYEHRMLRACLEKLRRQAQLYQMAEQGDRRDLAGERVDPQELTQARRRLEERLKDPRQPDEEDLRAFCLEVLGVPEAGPSKDAGGYQVLYHPPGDRRVRVLLHEDRDRGLFNSLVMPASCGVWQCGFFKYCIDEMIACWESAPRRGGETLKVSFFMTYSSASEWIGRRDGTSCKVHTLTAGYLDHMTLGSRSVRFRNYVEDLRARLNIRKEQEETDLIQCIQQGKLPGSGDDGLFCDASLVELAAKQETMLATRSDWKGLMGQIDRLLASPILGVRTRRGEQLHASNLFTHHSLYRRAYVLMRRRQEQFEAIDLWAGRDLPLSASPHIYEYWCLLKMLSIWVNDYGFTLETPTIQGLTGDLLRHREKVAVGPIRLVKQPGALKGKMVVELEYDRGFRNNHPKNAFQKQLWPDFCLTVSYRGKTCRFFLDAKYHNYEQMGIGNWYDTLYDVALRKYLVCLDETTLNDGTPLKTSGAYLLHADEKTGPSRDTGWWDPRKFFWYGTDTKTCSAPGSESAQALQKAQAQVGKDVPNLLRGIESLRFGSVCFTPGTSIHYRALIQMIMEHFLGFPELYRGKCWLCGGEDLEVVDEDIGAGYKKYHITCKSCGQFWVQTICNLPAHHDLGKHRNNYCRPKQGDPWYVDCPDCASPPKTDPEDPF